MKTKTLTILFADVQGYTSRTGRQSREENELFVREIRTFVQKHANAKGGTFVKAMGDGFLITFESPTDAVSCGREMQRNIEQRNASVLDESNFIRFRIGISTGEVTIDENNDVYGEAVNIAARIESFAEPNDVFISESTYLAMNKAEINALDLGPQRFKNIVEEVRVYKVLKNVQSPLKTLKRPRSRNRNPVIIGIITFLSVLVMVLLALLLYKSDRQSQRPLPEALSHETRSDIKRLLQEGEYDAVIGLAEERLEKDPDNIKLRELLSHTYLKMRDYGQAEKYLMQAIELKPEVPRLYYKMADVYEQAGEYRDAVRILKEYLDREHNPQRRRNAMKKIRELANKL